MITRKRLEYDYEKEIGVLLGEQQRQQEEADEIERELNLYRGGSAPPTVDGAVSATGGLFSGGGGAPFLEFGGVNKGIGFGGDDEEFRKDPAYLSLFSMPPGFEQMKQQHQHEFEAESTSASSSERDANGLIGLPGLDLGGKQKSFVDFAIGFGGQYDLHRVSPKVAVFVDSPG